MIKPSRRDYETTILHLPSLETQLAAWIAAVDKGLVSRNLTLRRSGFKLYVRRAARILDDAHVTTLDIASITIPEKFRGRGWFRAFRALAEAINPWDATYYEAVVNPRLVSYFRTERLGRDGENSFYVTHTRAPLPVSSVASTNT